MYKATLLAVLSVTALSACFPEAVEPVAEAPVATAAAPTVDPTQAPAQTAGLITSTGKVTAIDAAAGAIILDHPAIPAVKWDAMTMAFTTTDPAMLKDLKVGDTVTFDLKSATQPTKISRIEKQ